MAYLLFQLVSIHISNALQVYVYTWQRGHIAHRNNWKFDPGWASFHMCDLKKVTLSMIQFLIGINNV